MGENTFLGLQPYTEADAYRFKGRVEESQELFRLIVRNDYTVCYAESGEGKTSLLNAGVFPLLRQNMYFPIAITFTSDDYERTPDSFDTIVDRCIKDSISDYNEKNKGINIEYKLCSTDFQDTDCQSALQQELSKYLWWKLRNYKPQAMGLTFTPVFVFDQFEEVFNLPGSIVWTKKFFDWLEDVSSDSCPQNIIDEVRAIVGKDAAFPTIKEEKDFNAVFSLRKEFIGELDYWCMQKCFIPSLKDNRYCLKALTYEGAKKVMTQQQRFAEDKLEQVLHYFVQQYSREPEKTIAENLPVIPALLLSVVCDSWEKDINYFSDIDAHGIDQSLNKILEKFCDEAIGSVINELFQQEGNSQAEPIRKDIEVAIFALVDGNGKRVRRKSSELSHLDFDAKYKEILSEKRIIKISKVDGEDYVEIVHDSMCPIIAKRKDLYLAAEAKTREEEKIREQVRKRQKRIITYSMFCLAIVAIVAFIIVLKQNTELKISIATIKSQQEQIIRQDSVIYYADLYKKWRDLLEQKQYDEAFKYLKASAEGNNCDAFSDLAYHLYIGTVYEHDIKLAEQYARCGAVRGDENCQLWLGQILKDTNREKEALQWLIKSAEQGQGWSAFLVGEMYENGDGTFRDIEKAIYWYRISAKNHMNAYHVNAEEALNRLGQQVYEKNEYMKLVEEAHVWPYRSPKELYDYEGMWWRADKEPEQFAALLAAAEQGYPHAQEELGEILVSDDARELGIYDEKKSKEWLAKAAIGYVDYIKNLENEIDEGDNVAMEELGNIYYWGQCGKKKDLMLAEKYFRMGAKLGNDGCQLWLGKILREKGQKKEALRWLEKSGEQGQGWSAYLAGEMYENGEGIPKNMKKAIEWYNKSAKTNNSYAENAKEALIRLGQPVPEDED